MRAEEIKDGDIVEIDYITEYTKEHCNEGKALVLWKGFNHQPLIMRLGTEEYSPIWTCYEHISRVVGHIPIGEILKEQARWVPISEGLPKAQENGDKDYSDWVQVTIDIGRNGDNDVYVCEAYYCFSENKWYTKRFVVGVVKAWKPLPQPYKESEVSQNADNT